jgi:5-methylcytosine-specific restriction endonuclease McrA
MIPHRDAKRIGSKAALRLFLSQNIGVVLTSQQLSNAANGASEWGRRLRELRDEEGFQIRSHKDDKSLRPDQYRLDTLVQLPVQARSIDKKLRAQVLSEAAGVCQWCGAEAGKPHPEYPEKTTRLQVSHVVDKSKGGTDSFNNLIALCSFCNEGASVETREPPREIQLYSQIRRAPRDVQWRVFEKLRDIFKDGV